MDQHQRDSFGVLRKQCHEMYFVLLMIIIGDRRSEMGERIHSIFMFAPGKYQIMLDGEFKAELTN